MALSPILYEILACPEDKGPVIILEPEGVILNPRLSRTYEIRDEIPIMLIDEATAVDAAEVERLLAVATDAGIAPTFEA